MAMNILLANVRKVNACACTVNVLVFMAIVVLSVPVKTVTMCPLKTLLEGPL